MRILKIILLSFIIVLLIFLSRGFIINKNGKFYYGTNNVIHISELILTISEKRGIDYCELLRNSFKSDDGFRDFITLRFFDGEFIDHSYAVSKLYEYFGHDEFWRKSETLSAEEKHWVRSYLEYAQSEKESAEASRELSYKSP